MCAIGVQRGRPVSSPPGSRYCVVIACPSSESGRGGGVRLGSWMPCHRSEQLAGPRRCTSPYRQNRQSFSPLPDDQEEGYELVRTPSAELSHVAAGLGASDVRLGGRWHRDGAG